MANRKDVIQGKGVHGVSYDHTFQFDELEDIVLDLSGFPNFTVDAQFSNCVSIAGNVIIEVSNFPNASNGVSVTTLASTVNGLVTSGAEVTSHYKYLIVRLGSGPSTPPTAGSVRIAVNANS